MSGRAPPHTPTRAAPAGWFTASETEGLDDFFRVYRDAYDELDESALRAAAADPHFGPVLRAIPAERLADQRAESRRRLELGMTTGDWSAYEESLRAQGEVYATAGVPYESWHNVVREAARGLMLRLVEAHAAEPDRLCRAVLAAEAFTGWVMLVSSSAYVETRQGLAAAERARRSAIVDAALDCIVTMDAEGRITELNPAAVETFGYEREQAIGQPLAELLVPPDLRQAHRDGLARVVETGEARVLDQRLSLQAMRADGSEVPVELTVCRLPGSGPPEFTGFIRDTSELERRAAELERSNAELEQFAYVASHDLQEPLRMVANYTELLAKRYQGQLDERADKYIHYASDGARRMQRLVSDLLAYSRVGSQGRVLEPVDSGAVLEHALGSLGRVIHETGASVERGRLPVVLADEAQLRQLFQNLTANAMKFRGDEPPRISITAERHGRHWHFSVVDNGIGIDMKYAERVFQMFQRLHERGRYEGSGIGLAIAKRIVERHEGRIWVESEPGAGSTFQFTLQAVPET